MIKRTKFYKLFINFKTSLYRALDVLFVSVSSASKNNNFNYSIFWTLDSGTYNWPCVKKMTLKKQTTFVKNYLWLVLIIIRVDILWDDDDVVEIFLDF